jgi:uncharacterized protein YecE (DUF72 family)
MASDRPSVVATEYRVGTASWLDQSLIASGRFYPRPAMSAEDRLRWYARFFDCVEVNSTYYALPSPRNSMLWAERTPAGFLFHVKAYSLMTGHHPRLDALPPEVRLMLPDEISVRRHGEVDREQFPPEALDRCFDLFRAALEPLAAAGKLGYVLFQLAPWVHYQERTLTYLASLPARLPGWTLAVEFRNATWIPERTDEIVAFLRERGLVLATVDSVWQPWVEAATTAEWSVLRLHGRNLRSWLAQRAGRELTVAEKYDYLYDTEELGELAARTRRLRRQARQVAVTFNNNHEDFPTQNALDLKRLLGLDAPDLAAVRAAWRPGRRRAGPGRAPAEADLWSGEEERTEPRAERIGRAPMSPDTSSTTGSFPPAASGRASSPRTTSCGSWTWRAARRWTSSATAPPTRASATTRPTR